VRACLPALLVTALICAVAGAAAGDALAQSQTGAATARPVPSEPAVNPGLAPPMPCIGGRVSVCCDHPDLAYHPRCLEWRPKYERWRRAYDAYHRG
jgi:hypothetical protein